MRTTITRQFIGILERAAQTQMSVPKIIEELIKEFKGSERYVLMQQAEQYYLNRSDVQSKANDLPKRSNAKIEEPIVKKLITQKVDYLMSRPFSVSTDASTEGEDAYAEQLNTFFDNDFKRVLKAYVRSVIKYGIAYLQPYFDDQGALHFMRLPPTEVIPIWLDSDHTLVEGFIRFYDTIYYQGTEQKTRMAAEYWTADGVEFFLEDDSGGLSYDVTRNVSGSHLSIDGAAYNWDRVPLIWIKYNEEEMPLFYFIKELVDDNNWQLSITADVLRDVAKFIYVLKDYGGADLEEFMTDLRKYLAIKLEGSGGVDKLSADVNIDAVMRVLDKYRRDIYDYAAGVDTKDPDLGTASGVSINFRYMDLENDCQNLASELRYAFEKMKPFIDLYFAASGAGDFYENTFEIIMNTDMPVEESGIIESVKASWGIISKKTAIANHPWVNDVEEELKQIEKERQADEDIYGEGLFSDVMQIGGENYSTKPGLLGEKGAVEGTGNARTGGSA